MKPSESTKPLSAQPATESSDKHAGLSLSRGVITALLALLPTACAGRAVSPTVPDLASCPERSMRHYRYDDSLAAPNLDLLIIAPDEFVPELERLRDHKNSSGMPTSILSREFIVQTFEGWDDPERIKRAIAKMGHKYVFLVGDASWIPVRHRFVGQVMDKKENSCRWLDGTYNPSDFYYANLWRDHQIAGNGQVTHSGVFDDWDKNSDGKYNEQLWKEGTGKTYNPDQVDGYPDISVGRLPAHSVSDVRLYVDRVIRYETTKMDEQNFTFLTDKNQNGSFRNRTVLMNQNDAIPQGGQSQFVGLNYNKKDTLPAPWSAGSAKTVLKHANEAFWLSYYGHGFTKGWEVPGLDHKHMIRTPLADEAAPIVFSNSCDSGQFMPNIPFGRYIDETGVPHDYIEPECDDTMTFDKAWSQQVALPLTIPRPSVYDLDCERSDHRSFASTWLFQGKGGAVAFLGHTIVMPGGPSGFLEHKILSRLANGVNVLGDAINKGQIEYWKTFRDNGDILGNPRIYLSSIQLLGDPSLRLHLSRANKEVGIELK